MTQKEIFDKISDLLVSQLPVTKEQIKPESKLADELGADSANIMMLVFDVENEFSIQVDNDILETLSTVQDVVNYIEKALQ